MTQSLTELRISSTGTFHKKKHFLQKSHWQQAHLLYICRLHYFFVSLLVSRDMIYILFAPDFFFLSFSVGHALSVGSSDPFP